MKNALEQLVLDTRILGYQLSIESISTKMPKRKTKTKITSTSSKKKRKSTKTMSGKSIYIEACKS